MRCRRSCSLRAGSRSSRHTTSSTGSNVDIYLRRSGDHTEGVAIIAAQPRQLTIVNIVGSIDLAKLAQLQGQFGVPKVGLTPADPPKTASADAQTH